MPARQSLRTPLAAGLILLAGPAAAADFERLGQLTLEELTLVEVTSVSGRAERLSRAAASVFVVTGDDIGRANPGTLPEALRLAPNLSVSRVDTLNYVVTARGFGGYEPANKLLVLIDGRSVYSPLQSGIFWDAQNVMLEDVDRIEVVSGPGGTLWGSNAVNGVVSVVGKAADATQGTLATATVGTEDRRVAARHGGRVGDAAYRIYAMGFDRRRPPAVGGPDTRDDWRGVQGGFRLDWPRGDLGLTVQGDIYRSEAELVAGPTLRVPFHIQGANLLGRWTAALSPGSDLEVQGYVDRFDYNATSGVQKLTTVDVQARHVVRLGTHSLVWGGGYRVLRDDYRNPFNAFQLDPPRRWLRLANLFVQDEIAVGPDLRVVLGLKVEDSSFTGFEYLPNARVAWTPTETDLLWAAVSRAARAPNRIERELVAPGILVKGDFESEKVIALEAGYRGALGSAATLSITGFYNIYNDIRATEPVGAPILPVRFGNAIEGETYGIEAWTDLRLAEGWQVGLGVTTLEKDFRLEAGRRDITGLGATGNDPSWQLSARSKVDFTGGGWLDLRVRRVGALPRPAVPAYTAVDATLGWPVAPGLDLIVTGVNLLDARHAEIGPPPAQRAFRRAVSLSARWSF